MRARDPLRVLHGGERLMGTAVGTCQKYTDYWFCCLWCVCILCKWQRERNGGIYLSGPTAHVRYDTIGFKFWWVG